MDKVDRNMAVMKGADHKRDGSGLRMRPVEPGIEDLFDDPEENVVTKELDLSRFADQVSKDELSLEEAMALYNAERKKAIAAGLDPVLAGANGTKVPARTADDPTKAIEVRGGNGVSARGAAKTPTPGATEAVARDARPRPIARSAAGMAAGGPSTRAQSIRGQSIRGQSIRGQSSGGLSMGEGRAAMMPPARAAMAAGVAGKLAQQLDRHRIRPELSAPFDLADRLEPSALHGSRGAGRPMDSSADAAMPPRTTVELTDLDLDRMRADLEEDGSVASALGSMPPRTTMEVTLGELDSLTLDEDEALDDDFDGVAAVPQAFRDPSPRPLTPPPVVGHGRSLQPPPPPPPRDVAGAMHKALRVSSPSFADSGELTETELSSAERLLDALDVRALDVGAGEPVIAAALPESAAGPVATASAAHTETGVVGFSPDAILDEALREPPWDGDDGDDWDDEVAAAVSPDDPEVEDVDALAYLEDGAEAPGEIVDIDRVMVQAGHPSDHAPALPGPYAAPGRETTRRSTGLVVVLLSLVIVLGGALALVLMRRPDHDGRSRVGGDVQAAIAVPTRTPPPGPAIVPAPLISSPTPDPAAPIANPVSADPMAANDQQPAAAGPASRPDRGGSLVSRAPRGRRDVAAPAATVALESAATPAAATMPAGEEAEPTESFLDPAETAAANLPDTPSRAQVVAALESARTAVRRCAGGQGGVAEVHVVVGSSGRVRIAEVEGQFAHSAQGSCIARVVREARFPAFRQGRFEVSYPYQL